MVSIAYTKVLIEANGDFMTPFDDILILHPSLSSRRSGSLGGCSSLQWNKYETYKYQLMTPLEEAFDSIIQKYENNSFQVLVWFGPGNHLSSVFPGCLKIVCETVYYDERKNELFFVCDECGRLLQSIISFLHHKLHRRITRQRIRCIID